jgi:hypothetical protein
MFMEHRGRTMADIIGWSMGLALIGLVVWATVAMAGGGGRKAARRRGGAQMMAAMLLGFGAALDPPQRHVAEAKDETPKSSPETGEPELDD